MEVDLSETKRLMNEDFFTSDKVKVKARILILGEPSDLLQSTILHRVRQPLPFLPEQHSK